MKTLRKYKPTIIDLFSGCGGFALGGELAGCKTLVAIDIDPDLQSTYRLNFPNSNPIQANVASLEPSSWRSLLGRSRPDGIIGGPPCQGFSRIGKRLKDDPRNSLVAAFYRQVAILKPKFFIMENVEGLLDHGNIQMLHAGLDAVAAKYRVIGPLIINAKDFGAPTSRRRVIVIGYDPKEVDPLRPEVFQTGSSSGTTVRDAIADLPRPISISLSETDFGWAHYPRKTSRALPTYADRMRTTPKSGLGWKVAIERLKAGYVSGQFETRHSRSVLARFAKVQPGDIDRVSKCPRLDWNGVCPTLRAGTGSERGSFQSIRPLHPVEPRVITVREAARLQGFPDWFVFHPTKWHSFRMIGNSVSPSVSYNLITAILSGMSDAVAA